MWIFSKFGFFSIVKKGGHGKWQVRARQKHDLTDLIAKAHLYGQKIIETTDSDYQFRLVIDSSDLGAVMDAFEQSIDYSNYKNSLSSDKRQDKLHTAAHRVWSVMADLQPKRPYSGFRQHSGWDSWYSRTYGHNPKIKQDDLPIGSLWGGDEDLEEPIDADDTKHGVGGTAFEVGDIVEGQLSKKTFEVVQIGSGGQIKLKGEKGGFWGHRSGFVLVSRANNKSKEPVKTEHFQKGDKVLHLISGRHGVIKRIVDDEFVELENDPCLRLKINLKKASEKTEPSKTEPSKTEFKEGDKVCHVRTGKLSTVKRVVDEYFVELDNEVNLRLKSYLRHAKERDLAAEAKAQSESEESIDTMIDRKLKEDRSRRAADVGRKVQNLRRWNEWRKSGTCLSYKAWRQHEMKGKKGERCAA